MNRLLERFGVLPDEKERLAWLLAHSLLNGLTLSFFFSAATALFVESFGSSALAGGYVVSALLAFGVLRQVQRWGQRVSFANRVVGQLVFLAATIAVGWWATMLAPDSLLVRFALFVAIGSLFSILGLEFWSLTSRLFDVRQGKRLFALVGSGEVLTTFLGFLLVRFLLEGVSTVYLLAVSAVAAAVLVGVGWLLVIHFRDRLSTPAAAPKDSDSADRKPAPRRRGSSPVAVLRQLTADPYFRFLALMVMAAVTVNYLVDFNFLTQLKVDAQGVPRDARAIAEFMSLFFAAVKLVELGVRLGLSNLLVRQFGLGTGLLLLPGSLLGIAGLGVLSQVGGLALTLSALSIAAKAVVLIFLPSLFEPSLRVLFQPLPEERRLAVQGQVEGGARQLATLASGLGLLVVSQVRTPAPAFLFLAMVPLLLAWLFLGRRLLGLYQRSLMETLEGYSDRSLAVSATEVLKERLKRIPADEIQDAVNLLARVDTTAVAPLLEELIQEGDTARRRAALSMVGTIRLEAVTPLVERLASATVEEEPDGGLRRTATWAHQRLMEMRRAAEDPQRLRELAASDDRERRGLAASALGYAVDPTVRRVLHNLLKDREIRVRRAALVAAGRRGEGEFRFELLQHLAVPEYANAAAFGLILFGEGSLMDLEKVFTRARQQPAVRARILRIYQRLAPAGSGAAQRFLVDKLHSADRSVRRKASIALSLSDFRAESKEDVGLLHDCVEGLVGEIVWNLTAKGDLGGGPREAEVRQALDGEIQEARHRILLLLSLLYDRRALRMVRRSLAGGNPAAMVFALETLETMLSPQLRPVVMPVLEPLTPLQCRRRLRGRFYVPRKPLLDRLQDVVHRDRGRMDLWPQACALDALARRPRRASEESNLRRHLLAAFHHPEALLHEIATHHLLALDRHEVVRRLPRLTDSRRAWTERLVRRSQDSPTELEHHWRYHTLYRRLGKLRQVNAFADLPGIELLRLATTAELVHLGLGETLEQPHRRSVDVVLDGYLSTLGTGSGANPGALVVPDPDAPPRVAQLDTWLLRLDGEVLFELMADYGELVPAILQEAEGG